MKQEYEASLRLFKGYLIEETDQTTELTDTQLLEKGLLFEDYVELLTNKDTIIKPAIPQQVVDIAYKMYGKKPEQWNQTFHKSFSTVRDTPIETLIAQQIIHYFTTYGLEELGIYDEDLVYIPHEKLEIPELEGDIPLVVIRRLTVEQLQEKLMVLLTSGIALSADTIKDIMTLSDYIPKERFGEIKNKEVKITLYDKYNIVPNNALEFLRYLIYKLTGSTLLIKGKDEIKAIKQADTSLVYKYLKLYLDKDKGMYKLAYIFLRYKELFLALKRTPKSKSDLEAKWINHNINVLKDEADKLHRKHLDTVVTDDILDYLTNILNEEHYLQARTLIAEELNNVTVYREITILNAIRYRLTMQNEANLYRIRNGKAWVDLCVNQLNYDTLPIQERIYGLVYTHLIERLTPKLKGKSVYIPKNITYTLPTSEKQFTGNIPEGSYITIPRPENKAMVIGVHWDNVGPEPSSDRVDLDLHLQNKTEHYGWNSMYRSDMDSDFYFSGDVTNAPAPNGATELYYIGKTIQEKSFLLTLNRYSGGNGYDIPYQFIVAESNKESVDKNYVVDPNKVLLTLHQKFVYKSTGSYESQKVLGLVKINEDEIRIYFNDMTLGNSIVTRQNEVIKGAYQALNLQAETKLTFNSILESCGAKLVDEPYGEKLEEVEINGETLYRKVRTPVDYNLSLETIDKTTLIKMLSEV